MVWHQPPSPIWCSTLLVPSPPPQSNWLQSSLYQARWISTTLPWLTLILTHLQLIFASFPKVLLACNKNNKSNNNNNKRSIVVVAVELTFVQLVQFRKKHRFGARCPHNSINETSYLISLDLSILIVFKMRIIMHPLHRVVENRK